MEEFFLLYDDITETKTRFISFADEHSRYDLCLIYSDRFFEKVVVLNMLSSRFAIIGKDDLEEEGYLEDTFQIATKEADELKEFLTGLI
ncbi:MAG: hypothetical protein K0R18_1830 [Bacillales bacterium]|jgi:hypothetical protein|nr:hypothetical protein [Bacillales bacterium]